MAESDHQEEHRGSRSASALSFLRRGNNSRAHSVSSHHEDNESEDVQSQHSHQEGELTDKERLEVEYTKKHPLGKILLNLHTDNVNTATKSGMKEMTSNLKELCANFHRTMT